MAYAICAIISLGGASPRRSLQHTRDSNETSRLLSLLCLAPDGGYLAACITANAGGLLHHHFTITAPPEGGGGCLFLWPCSGRLPRPGCYPTSRSVECGLSSSPLARTRDCPTSLRVFIIHGGRTCVNSQTVDISGKDIKIEKLSSTKELKGI